MRSGYAAAVMLITLATARADTPEPAPDERPKTDVDPEVMARIRVLYEQKDYLGVKRELLAAFEATQHPGLLFALGQVELALENCPGAIEYYEKFIATGPAEEQIALAQQGIGAARMCIEKPKPQPAPPPPPRRREWFASDTVVVAVGGGLALGGAALVLYGRRLGNDHGGTLSEYDARADRARTLQWTGTGLAAAGALAAGVALLRWRLRPHDEAPRATLTIAPAGVTVFARW